MAEALLQLRVSRAYEEWGYPDLYAYCSDELLLKRRTVDKLTGSYSTLQQHAPEVLRSDEPAPSYDAVDYYQRALDAAGPPEVLEELREAVFDQEQPVGSLRRKFHPVLFVKSDEENQLAALERLNSTVKRLVDTLPNVDGLAPERVSSVAATLTELQMELEDLVARAQQRVAAA